MGHERRTALRSKVLLLCALVVVLCFLLPGCQKQRPKPQPAVQAPPAAPKQGGRQLAEQAFRDGRCADAVAEYALYLQANPEAPDRDAVLFRVAVCRLLPQSTVYDADESLRILNEIVTRFPGSSFRPNADLILTLTARAREQVAELEQCKARIQKVSEELETARRTGSDTRTQLQILEAAAAKERQERDARIRQLSSTVEELEARVRRLTEDLDALKKIDLQRRPSRPNP